MRINFRVRKYVLSLILSSMVGSVLSLSALPANAQSKKDFFESAKQGGEWWQNWGTFSDTSIFSQEVLSRSEIIVRILQSDYGVTVPFDPTSPGAVPKGVYMRNREVVAGNWCPKVVANQLGRAVAAIHVMVSPAMVFPDLENTSGLKESSRENLNNSFILLGKYCGNAPFVAAFQRFSEEYAQVLQETLRAETQIVQREQDAAAAIEQAEKAKEEAETKRRVAAQEIASKKQVAIEEKFKVEINAEDFKVQNLRAQYYSCQENNAYKILRVENDISENKKSIGYYESVIQREEDGAKYSGFVDKEKMYKAGQAIAQFRTMIANNFARYKKLGGLAPTGDTVTITPDPCAQLYKDYSQSSQDDLARRSKIADEAAAQRNIYEQSQQVLDK